MKMAWNELVEFSWIKNTEQTNEIPMKNEIDLCNLVWEKKRGMLNCIFTFSHMVTESENCQSEYWYKNN